MIRRILTAALLFGTAAIAQAQQSFKITDIKPTLEFSPEFTFNIGPQRKATSQQWLWVEVSFVYQSAVRNAPALDNVAINYYILLNDVGPGNPTGTLLTGTVTHTGVSPGTDVHHSVALISPQTLKRYFGKTPASPTATFRAIGVTATIQGQLVAENSIGLGKGQLEWWQKFQQGPSGLVLSKEDTPFAPLFYDYFEATKAKGSNN